MSDGAPLDANGVQQPIPPYAYILRDEVSKLLAEAGPDLFASGITPEGRVIVWMDNRSFEAIDSRHGIVLRPLIDGRHKRRRPRQ